MKEIKIALSGEKEEQIAQHIMKSVYEAINEHGYCDINLCADTIPEPRKDIQMSFMGRWSACIRRERGHSPCIG